VRKQKRTVYVVATLVAVAIFIAFQSQPWSLYVAACAGYTILVFGLRRINEGGRAVSNTKRKSPSDILVTHASFLAIVIGWVWLCIFLAPHLPYFLRTEDTRRPFFGLAFLGIFGLMCIEYLEQRWLRPDPEIGVLDSEKASSK
jgi:hypothetical protein